MTEYGAIFDNDGTLMRTMDEWIAVMQHMAEESGGTFSQQDVDFLTTTSVPEACTFLASHPTSRSDCTAEHLADFAWNHMLEYYATRSVLKVGVEAYMRMLHEQGIPVYIVSSSPYACLESGMDHCGLTTYITGILSAEREGISKREPTLFLKAAAAMGTLPENTWVFEDALYSIRVAKSAGFRTVGIDDGGIVGTYEDFIAEADIAIHDFTDLQLVFPPAKIIH